MARHNSSTSTATNTDHGTACTTALWRDALGPGYAVGPSGRLIDYVARASGAGSPA